ncbi:YozQ family protein [Metabacillus halosaccharovorans]|uniref:YozQ family protein n=1 Tax=Metabacillus halosaccharovorans TaxID=930124 RepID=A0ABT3DFP7_9BACI|nr:YozQ family protein [Metabacillus halosaccharovorans]MCV9885884.1 YozQ family protein [Metabacillus halosaccharovorans]
MKKTNNSHSSQLAGKTYEVEDYKASNTLSSGLATTHEQASDAYMEGEVNAVIDNVEGEDIQVKREGYKNQ